MDYLFVCTGNTCRSPMAKALFDGLSKRMGLSFETESAGLCGGGAPASENARLALLEYGLDISAHRSKEVTDALVMEAEEVICMTRGHADILKERYPHMASKIGTLLERDISDPYGGSFKEYEKTAEEIIEGVRSLLNKMVGGERNGRENSSS